jgi:hypothetical protein
MEVDTEHDCKEAISLLGPNVIGHEKRTRRYS